MKREMGEIGKCRQWDVVVFGMNVGGAPKSQC